MADLQNLIGLEKPLEKLIETVGEGFGVVGNAVFKFDAKRIKRIGEAQAEAEKTKIIKKAEGEADAIVVLNRASKRFALEQYNRQINLENIVVKSKEYLERNVSDQPVDKDWTARFLSVAQEVSREEIQELLAKILAGEVSKPNTYSLRALEVIRNLSRNELEGFKKFIALSTPNGYFHIHGANREPLLKYGLHFGDFVHLADIGLFNPSTMLSLSIEVKSLHPAYLAAASHVFLMTSETDKSVNLGILKFTDAGMQIYELLLSESSNPNREAYINDFTEHLKSQGIDVNKGKK